MKQYCRYCINLVFGDVPYCSCHEKVVSESYAKGVNKCKDFEFCEVDAFGETDGYKPRKATGEKIVQYELFKE